METQIINNLIANLMGCGKQLASPGASGAPADGQNEFFALFSEKMMNSIFGTILPQSANDMCKDPGAGDQREPAAADITAPAETAAPSCDGTDVSFIVSAIAVALEQSAALTPSAPPQEKVSSVVEFLNKILDVLSGGDEVELVCRTENRVGDEGQADREDTNLPAVVAASGTAATVETTGAENDAGTETVEIMARPKAPDNSEENSLAGPVAVFLSALDQMVSQETGSKAARVDRTSVLEPRDVKNIPQSRHVDVPVPVKTADPGIEAVEAPEETVRKEAPAGPAIQVDVTKSSIENKIIDVSWGNVKKGSRVYVPAVAGNEEIHEAKEIPENRDMRITERTEPDRIVVRVAEKDGPDEKSDADDGSANENGPGLHANSRPDNGHERSEIHNTGKSSFSRAMVDKIEKIAEQYSGKNLGMDMTVKLKIDDNETILVGLRDEGTRVTVEVKTANENTMNLIQSQKEGIIKDLEQKHVMTTIHVDIDQDAQGRQQRDRHREKGQDDPDEAQGFGTFFEAMA